MTVADWNAVAGLVLVAVLAAVGTWWARRYALRRDLLDHPGDRRSHAVPTPRGGGIAIVIGFAGVVGALLAGAGGQRPLLAAGMAGLLLVAGVGWIDDHRGLPAPARLAAHAVAAASLGWAAWGSGLAPWLSVVLALATVAMVNAWNFMDGIDGIASLQALVVAGGIAAACASVGDGASAWLAAGLGAACIGFLPFNFPHARIFLGDVGSGALGFALALVAAQAMLAQPRLGWMVLTGIAPFAVDTALTLARRMLQGECWWQAHASHRYQHWARGLGRHWPVTLAYAVWGLVGMAVLGRLRDAGAGAAVASVAWYVLTALVWWLGRKAATQVGRERAR